MRLDWAYLNPADREAIFAYLKNKLETHFLTFWGKHSKRAARLEDAKDLGYLLSVRRLYAALEAAYGPPAAGDAWFC